jgi:hypothetical protein
MSGSNSVKEDDINTDGEIDGDCPAGHPASPVAPVTTSVAADPADHLAHIGGWTDVVSRTILRTVVIDDREDVPADQRAQKMSFILSRVQTDGHLVRMNRRDDHFWLHGKLPDKVELIINPFPAIYQDWIAGHRVRQHVYDLWVGLKERPTEGFFFWLHSTITLLVIHASPENVSSFNGLLREASRHGTSAVLHAQSLFKFGHMFKEMLDGQMQMSLAKQMLYTWAATNFNAFTALASRLKNAAPQQEKWWIFDSQTCDRVAKCDLSPLLHIPIPDDACFVFA